MKKKKNFEAWEIRQALEDLERAEKVKDNPDLMKEVEKEAKKKVDYLKRIKWVK
jgi:hypothetical protein